MFKLGFTRSFRARYLTAALVVTANLACSKSSSDRQEDDDSAGNSNGTSGGTQNGDGDTTESGSGGTGGSPGNPDGTGGGSVDVGTDCDGPLPAGAVSGSLAEIGVPYDLLDDEEGPDNHNAAYGQTPQIVTHVDAQGCVSAAWLNQANSEIVISRLVNDNGQYRAHWHLKGPAIDRLAGFTRDDEGNYYYLTAIDENLQSELEPSEEHRDNVLQLVKYSSGGEHLYTVDLRTEINGVDLVPIYAPMDAGTGRMVMGGGQIMLVFSRLGENGGDGRHQGATYIQVDAASGEATNAWGGISHSFDQRLAYDGVISLVRSLVMLLFGGLE